MGDIPNPDKTGRYLGKTQQTRGFVLSETNQRLPDQRSGANAAGCTHKLGDPPVSVQSRVVSESMATVIARMSGTSSPAATSTP
jgi:hypothetical protein